MRITSPENNGAKTKCVVEDQLLYQPLLYQCLKAMSRGFIVHAQSQQGWVCLTSRRARWGGAAVWFPFAPHSGDILWCLLPGAPVAEAQPGHHLLPSKGKQEIHKPASSWARPLQGELRSSSSAGSLRGVPWLPQWPAAGASAVSAGSWTELSIFCPMVWENAVIWTRSNSI